MVHAEIACYRYVLLFSSTGTIPVPGIERSALTPLEIFASIIAIVAGFASIFGALFPNIRERSISKSNELFMPPSVLANMRLDVMNAPDEVSSLVALEQYDKIAYNQYIEAGYRIRESKLSLLVASIALFIVFGLIFACVTLKLVNDQLLWPLVFELILLTPLWIYAWVNSFVRSLRYRRVYNKAVKRFRKMIAEENRQKYNLKSKYDFRTITFALLFLCLVLFLSGMFVQRFYPIL